MVTPSRSCSLAWNLPGQRPTDVSTRRATLSQAELTRMFRSTHNAGYTKTTIEITGRDGSKIIVRAETEDGGSDDIDDLDELIEQIE